MVIYLDLVIISTIVVNTLIIEGINTIFNEKTSFVRVLISGILSVLLLFIYLYPIGKITWIRYLLGILLGYVSFNKTSVKNTIIKIVFYYLLNLSLVATLEIFKIKNIFFLIISTLLTITLGILTSFRNSFEQIVKINKKKYHALYDSGNLSYYNNTPIIYLDKRFMNNSFIFIGQTLINTVTDSKILDIYQGPKITLNKTTYEVFYAFTNLNDFDIILHKDIGGIRCLNF